MKNITDKTKKWLTVTVNSSLSWILPVFDQEMAGSSPVFSRSTCARMLVSLPTLSAISASLQSSEAKVFTFFASPLSLSAFSV